MKLDNAFQLLFPGQKHAGNVYFCILQVEFKLYIEVSVPQVNYMCHKWAGENVW